MLVRVQVGVGLIFAAVFFALSLALSGLAGQQLYVGVTAGKELVNVFVQSINTLIVSLAIFELGLGIAKEYGTREAERGTYAVVRRTITRFVGTVSIALVLEALIMIIKYSQLELAGNLHYPVAILGGASILLIGLGLFLQLSRVDCEKTEELARFPRRSHDDARARAAGDGTTRPDEALRHVTPPVTPTCPLESSSVGEQAWSRTRYFYSSTHPRAGQTPTALRMGATAARAASRLIARRSGP